MNDFKRLGLRSALAVAVAAFALSGCDSGSSSGGGGGGKTLAMWGGQGGDGASSSGGDGDYFELEKYTGPGDVALRRSGSVNTSFKKLSFAPEFGANPAVFTEDTTVATYADCAAAGVAAPATGVAYLVNTNTILWLSDGDATGCETAEEATGIDVQRRATVTFALNNDGGTIAYIDTSYDIRNDGVITTADISGTERGNLYLFPNSYIGSGTVLTNGTEDGQDGGDIYIYADYAFISSGLMDASGADSDAGDGGDAGYINNYSYYYFQNTGNWDASGGDAPAGTGGDGDDIYMYAYDGPVYNSGDLDVSGGDGEVGGDADYFNFYAYQGNFYNSGTLRAEGGDATAGDGGDGGYVDAYAWAGSIRNSGDVLASGGDTTDAASSGGDGDYIYVETSEECGLEGDAATPAGDILWTGNIETNGGDAVATGDGSGGDAGYVYAYADSNDNECTEAGGVPTEIAFVGYATLEGKGGDGTSGGDGADIYLYNWDTEADGFDDITAVAGNVVNEANLDLRGGNAVAGGASANAYGGDGGELEYETDDEATAILFPERSQVHHRGDVDNSAGNSREATGSEENDGSIYVFGYNGVTWSGNITSNGSTDIAADDNATDSYGGYPGDFEIYAETGGVVFNGNIEHNGGDGEYAGGSPNAMYIYGATVVVKGNISSVGGNADATLAGSAGGTGGWIELYATDPVSSSFSGVADYAGGTGTTAGDEGGFMKLITCYGEGC